MRITQVFLLIDKYQLTPAHEDIRIRIARAIDKLIVDCRYLLRVWPILLSWHWGGKVGREPLEFERIRPVLTVPQRYLTVLDAVRRALYAFGNDKARVIRNRVGVRSRDAAAVLVKGYAA